MHRAECPLSSLVGGGKCPLCFHFPSPFPSLFSPPFALPFPFPASSLSLSFPPGMSTRRKSQDRDETDTSTFKTDTRRDVPKNVSRPPRDRYVQDRDYIPAFLPFFLRLGCGEHLGSPAGLSGARPSKAFSSKLSHLAKLQLL